MALFPRNNLFEKDVWARIWLWREVVGNGQSQEAGFWHYYTS